MSFEFRQIKKAMEQNQLRKTNEHGYSLFELVTTMTVMAILVLGTIPLAQNAYKRQKELRLRESLRLVRQAIDEFKRDTNGACQQGAQTSGNPLQPGQNIPADPRSRVVISDCKIFEVDNVDRYPPTLESLTDGVTVKPRGLGAIPVGGGNGGSVFDKGNATEINQNKEFKKVYLRELPIDPMTGKNDWNLRSSYQTKDDGSWDEVNVFDIRSSSDQEALNEEKYSDW